ncbi:hypothetical protein FA13DRAFT_1619121 [Coprinellus micaceus]|uniref:NAD(P)-binding domain-containing protein n=1 Tax=Coprinellus micaceus TaxID=71717 RepID=A0A4Y7TZI3_COPMI|nr:hypothetical protein FA13DRAFT_1619121 [Coprinellus micaceus]
MSDLSNLNVLVVGGSRNIGYHSSLRLLDYGSTVTFLLRSPSAFDNDAEVQKHLQSGKARLVKGDATNSEDVQSAWAEAGKERPVDLLLFTVGFTGTPTFQLTKGFTMDPPDLVTKSLLNFLCTMPKTESRPKVIVLSASGVSPSSRKKTPLLLAPLYGYAISGPLSDKLGTERVIGHCAGWEWDTQVDGEPNEEIIGKDWQKREGLPVFGSLSAVVVRPAVLTDGECLADAAVASGKSLPYRTGPGEVGGYTVSRKDVAHFIVEGILKDWEKWGNKQLSVAY